MVVLAWSEKIANICKKYNLKLVEDNAQAHGCLTADGCMTGSLGDAGWTLAFIRERI